MPMYLVERTLPGVTMEQLAAIDQAAVESSHLLSCQGRTVRHLRTVFLPAESRCLCLFEATDASLAKEVNDAVGLPYTRIVNAYELPAPEARGV